MIKGSRPTLSRSAKYGVFMMFKSGNELDFRNAKDPVSLAHDPATLDLLQMQFLRGRRFMDMGLKANRDFLRGVMSNRDFQRIVIEAFPEDDLPPDLDPSHGFRKKS